MEKYCENCGAKLTGDSQFCPECGKNTEKLTACPKCGESIDGGEKFCAKCGTRINAPQSVKKESTLEKHKTPIILILIAAIIVIAIPLSFMIMDSTVGTQTVDVDGNEFKIPENFEYNATGSEEVIEPGIIHKEWNRNGEHIEITTIPMEGRDGNEVLKSLGGIKENRYGIDGYHHEFQNGDEAFSYYKGDKVVSISVSDERLFDKITVL